MRIRSELIDFFMDIRYTKLGGVGWNRVCFDRRGQRATGKVDTSTFSGSPLESEFLAGMSTFFKVKVDKILIGNPPGKLT